MKADKIFFHYEIVVEAFNRLINLLIQDEHHIKNNQINKIYETLDMRYDLMNFISRQKNILAQHQEKKAIITEPQVQHLNELSSRLHKIGNNNKRSISKAIYANRKILGLVSEILTKEITAVNYNRKGNKQNTSKFREAPYIAVNKKL